MIPAALIADGRSTDQEIVDFLWDRMPKDGTYKKTNIKVTQTYYDFENQNELARKQPIIHPFQLTRKITIERETSSKVGEGFKAFFSTFIGIAETKYNFDRRALDEAKTAIEQILSDQQLDEELNSEEFKSLYVNCKTIIFYQSLEANRDHDGPFIMNGEGIAYTCTAAVAAQKIIPLALNVLGSIFSAVKNCTIL